MSAQPRYSVVIPCHNAEATIGRALASVVDQKTAGLTLEVLVIDDGSSDRSGERASAFGTPVRVLRQANAGAAHARNRGIEVARGEFVAFLDADDEWLPGHLERADRVLRSRPDLVWYTCAYQREEPGGLIVSKRPDETALVDDAYFPDYFGLCAGWINIVPATIVRRSLLEALGGFDETLRTGEDLDLWFRIALGHPHIGYSAEPGAMYRYQSESLTRRGPYPTRRTLELVARSHARALEHGEGSSGRVRPLLSSWLVEALRHAAIAQDRAALREIARADQAPVPMRWRAVSLCARLLPGPCWRGALAAWERLRGARVARR